MSSWEERFSSKHQRVYYFNRQTGESSWTAPADHHNHPATVHLWHILLKHTGSRNPISWRHPNVPVERSMEQAIDELDALIPSLTSLDSFKQAAFDWSDCSSARRFGDLGPVKRGQMQSICSPPLTHLVEPFEEAGYCLAIYF